MTKTDAKITPLRGRVPCPECRRLSDRDYYPFCSERCKNRDLNRWFSGGYAIPGEPAEEDDIAAHLSSINSDDK